MITADNKEEIEQARKDLKRIGFDDDAVKIIMRRSLERQHYDKGVIKEFEQYYENKYLMK